MTTKTQTTGVLRKHLTQWIIPLLLILTSVPLHAQSRMVKLTSKNQSRGQTITDIMSQTGYKVVFNARLLDENTTVHFGKSDLPLESVMDRLIAGTGQSYKIDHRFIVIYGEKAAGNTSAIALHLDRNLTGTITNRAGNPLEGIHVTLFDVADRHATTYANGRFRIDGIASGNHVLKLTSADGEQVRFREVRIPESADADVTLTFTDEILTGSASERATGETYPRGATQSTAYFVQPVSDDHTIRALSDEPKTEFGFTPYDRMRSGYIPRTALKTNLLYLATTTLNIGVEFGLARRWTFDMAAMYNPFRLQNGGINLFWYAQPEIRYWFCQRFEKHFIGLHALGGQFNIGNVSFLTTTFENHRYRGWAAGGGLSYGYHLPLGGRWAMEFTAGAGYVYLEYDKYRCYDCDELVASKKRHYLGPTKAGISLIYMIK